MNSSPPIGDLVFLIFRYFKLKKDKLSHFTLCFKKQTINTLIQYIYIYKKNDVILSTCVKKHTNEKKKSSSGHDTFFPSHPTSLHSHTYIYTQEEEN